jgi:hypothetical protein
VTDQTLHPACLGRARARLGQGDLAAAAAVTALVPAGFRINATYSGAHARREHLVYTYLYRELNATVDRPFRGFTFEGVPHPDQSGRCRVLGTDATTPIFQPTKYPSIENADSGGSV